MRDIKSTIKGIFNRFGYAVSDAESFKKMTHKCQETAIEKVEVERALNKLLYVLLKCSPAGSEKFAIESFLHFSADKLMHSKSQVFQDLFVLYCLDEKKNGFFVEFGATNGIDLSNTYLLEKTYNWNGILAEPAKVWHHQLQANRGCIIDSSCVWNTTGQWLKFNETTIAELSFVNTDMEQDNLSNQRVNHSTYDVCTISLNDLLSKHNAPSNIDYMSLDTEGSEFEILQAFDFDKYMVRVITIEHNFTLKRELIFNLLKEKGYTRVFSKISLFDDWYIKDTI